MARPSKPLISRENALKAALRVIDDKQITGFSLAAVADELNVKAPSLYHHFKSKDDLLSHVAMSLLKEGELPALAPDPNWIEQIVRISVTSWRSVLSHPNAAPLLLSYLPEAMLMGAYEHWAHFLTVNDVPSDLHILILDGTDKLTFGSIIFTAERIIQGSELFPRPATKSYPYLSKAKAAERMSEEDRFAVSIHSFVHGVLQQFGHPKC